jgi:hypothetical protein
MFLYYIQVKVSLIETDEEGINIKHICSRPSNPEVHGFTEYREPVVILIFSIIFGG